MSVNGTITEEMGKALLEGMKKEEDFFRRHGIPHEVNRSAQATDAHRAWVKAVEHEYRTTPAVDGRVMLDTPIARKAFIVGFNRGKPQ